MIPKNFIFNGQHSIKLQPGIHKTRSKTNNRFKRLKLLRTYIKM